MSNKCQNVQSGPFCPSVHARVPLLLSSALSFVVSASPALAGDDSLHESLGSISRAINELAPINDSFGDFYFGWMDRPYARASLAIAHKLIRVLKRECELRKNGLGAIDDADVERMLAWLETVPQRARAAIKNPDFRPHRILIKQDMLVRADSPPLIAFLDYASSTRHHEAFGDFDILAAAGFRIHARPFQSGIEEEQQLLGRRADSLGICIFEAATPEQGDATMIPGHLMASMESLLTRPLSDHVGPTWTVAMAESDGDEDIGCRMARRALARGWASAQHFSVLDWSAPYEGRVSDRRKVIQAALWLDAFEGMTLGLMEGWRDLRDGIPGGRLSRWLVPEELEVIAHANLDLLRHRESIVRLRATPALALMVEPSAMHPGSSNWAEWIKPIWNGLIARQVRFDVVPKGSDRDDLARRYKVIHPLRREDGADPDYTVQRIERLLAVHSEHVYRASGRTKDGLLVPWVYVRHTQLADGRSCVAVINLSDEPREVVLRGVQLRGCRDVLADETIKDVSETLPLAPWTVRLLIAQ